MICTSERAHYDPGLRRKTHSEPWAIEAQSLLRGLRPPMPPGESLVLVYDEIGLAAACHYIMLDGEVGVEPSFYVASIGCAVRCQGEGVASALLGYVLDQIAESNFAHGTSWGVTTLIHEENQRSKALAAAHGFTWRWDEGLGYEMWGRL